MITIADGGVLQAAASKLKETIRRFQADDLMGSPNASELR
jgi:hypothetical protein